MSKFRKKPIVIEAYQTTYAQAIDTLEGTMVAMPGDWIITGVNGEVYPCKPDIFEKTYVPADGGPTGDAEHERAESLLGDVNKWMTRAESAEAELVRLRNALAGVTTLEALGALKDSDSGDAPDKGSSG